MKPKCKHRIRLSIGKGSDGIYHYKSFTGYGDTPAQAKREAERLSREWQVLHKTESKDASMTLSEAYAAYIDSKRNVLSPSTIANYERMSRINVPKLMPMKLDRITQADIQIAINEEASNHKPKTVRNIHGLLSAVLSVYAPDIILRTTLPKKERHEIYVPSNDDVDRLIGCANEEAKKIIILAAIGSLRRSEICGLTADDIDGNTITVRKVMVISPKGGYCIKNAPKSEAGYRTVTMPKEVMHLLVPSGDTDRIVGINPQGAYKAFKRSLRVAHLPDFRLHDLRHYQASILHALGVPDKYIMERGGWKTDSTLKNIYQHTMDEKRKEVEDSICDFFSDKFKDVL